MTGTSDDLNIFPVGSNNFLLLRPQARNLNPGRGNNAGLDKY